MFPTMVNWLSVLRHENLSSRGNPISASLAALWVEPLVSSPELNHTKVPKYYRVYLLQWTILFQHIQQRYSIKGKHMPLIQSLSELVHVAGVKISIFSVICKSGEGHWHLRAPMVIFCFVFFLVGDCYLFWVFVFVLLGGGIFFFFFFLLQDIKHQYQVINISKRSVCVKFPKQYDLAFLFFLFLRIQKTKDKINLFRQTIVISASHYNLIIS